MSSNNIKFSINGKLFSVNTENLTSEMSLATFIRDKSELTGTKLMCREGGCGACIVMLKGKHVVSKMDDIRAVNSVSIALVFKKADLKNTNYLFKQRKSFDDKFIDEVG